MEYCVLNIRQPKEDDLRFWFFQMGRQEQERITQFRREDDRLRSLCGNHLAREMLSTRLSCRPEELQFLRSPGGKPYLEGTPLHFNLTHSGDFAACVIDHSPVGIDLEVLRPIRPELCKKVCNSAELEFLYRSGTFDSIRFLQIWTAKEALLKLSGCGISTELRTVSVLQEGELAPGLLSLQTEDYILAIAHR